MNTQHEVIQDELHALGDPIPSVCRIADVCRIFQVSRSTFERLNLPRELGLVELDRIGRVRRFTGESVNAARQRTRWSRDRKGGPR